MVNHETFNKNVNKTTKVSRKAVTLKRQGITVMARASLQSHVLAPNLVHSRPLFLAPACNSGFNVHAGLYFNILHAFVCMQLLTSSDRLLMKTRDAYGRLQAWLQYNAASLPTRGDKVLTFTSHSTLDPTIGIRPQQSMDFTKALQISGLSCRPALSC